MTEREALVDLLEAIDLAIYSGDWKVDGACDPDPAIQRAKKALKETELMKEKLAERIRMTRLMKSLSQQNMADELGITVASYSNIERGVTELTVVRLDAIAKILGVTLQSLLPLEDSQNQLIQDPKNMYPENVTNFQLNEIINKLNQQQKEIEKLTSELNKLKK